MNSINTPTYFVGHPDGSYSMADPQPIPEFEWRYKDGGPVHPCRIPTGGKHACDEPEPTKLHFGLSLRDYMAAHASDQDVLMQAEVIRSAQLSKGGTGILPDGWHVKARYMHADLMLKAREQSGGTQ